MEITYDTGSPPPPPNNPVPPPNNPPLPPPIAPNKPLTNSRVSSALGASDLVFSTYLSGSSDDFVRDVVYDSAGNIYVTGGTASANFPTTVGAYDRTFNNGSCPTVGTAGPLDIFLTKLTPDGQIIWSTFLGGPCYDRAYGVEVVDSGPYAGIYLGGRSGPGFPTTMGPAFLNHPAATLSSNYGEQNAILVKFTISGQLSWATYYQENQDSKGLFRDIALDSSGNIYGVTTGDGLYKFDNSGLLVWKRLLQGTGPINTLVNFNVPSVRVFHDPSDGQDYIYASGGTNGQNLPTPNGYQTTPNANSSVFNDIYLIKLKPDNTVVFGTYIGGASGEAGETHNLAVDSQGNAYVGGYTSSATLASPMPGGGFDTTLAGGTDAFVAKISGSGTPTNQGKLLAVTYLEVAVMRPWKALVWTRQAVCILPARQPLLIFRLLQMPTTLVIMV